MSTIDFDVNRHEDYMQKRGASAVLTVGPFAFEVRTSDGLAMWFGFRFRSWAFGWLLEKGLPRLTGKND